MTEAQKALLLIRKALEEHRSSLTDHISSGNAKSFEEYKELTGKVYGLTYGVQEINDLLNRMEQSDE